MKMAFGLCSPRCVLVLLVISAVPLGYIITLERSKHGTKMYEYHSKGWMRECSKWDDEKRRFLVSLFEGGVAQIRVPEEGDPRGVLEEEVVIRDADVAGNASLGILIDRQRGRNRLLVVSADVRANLFSAVAAYDLKTWDRLFLTHLSSPGDEKSLADDVAVDEEGNCYITDAKASKIWKVGENGKLISIIRSPLFRHKEWYKNLVALNGIVYHPNGFLLVLHTISGHLYRVDTKTEEVKVVKIVGGSTKFGDGIELLSPTKIVISGSPSGRVVESLDGWETGRIAAKYSGPMHRLASAATVKDGKVYLNHMVGFGFPKRKHVILEAVFKSVEVGNV